MRQHQQSERHHPEAEDREEAEDTANDEPGADADPARAGARHRDMPSSQCEATRFRIQTEFLPRLLSCHSLPPCVIAF